MSEISSSNFSETAANNNATPPDGFPEGQAPSSVNNAAREFMAAVKKFWNRINGTKTSAGTGAAYTLTYDIAPGSYVNGERYSWKAHAANSASATANINALGVRPLKKQGPAGLVDLAANDIVISQRVDMVYDSGANALVIMSPLAQMAGITGEIRMYGGSAAPGGWLFADGSAISRTTFATLFAVYGTTWGAGDGSTTFNLPDLRGRAPIGVGTGSGLTARALAATGGEETHLLTTGEMPAHTHSDGTLTVASHTHSFSATTSSDAHTHTVPTSDGGSATTLLRAESGTSNGTLGNATTSSDAHTHTVSGTTGGSSPDVTGATGSAGSGASHNNMQPFVAVNFIIKT